MCRWMAWLGKPVLEELRFNAQHGIVDQSLHALGVGARGVEGAVRATFGISHGESLWAAGVWREIPEATAVAVHRGGVLEERPFRVPTLSVS